MFYTICFKLEDGRKWLEFRACVHAYVCVYACMGSIIYMKLAKDQ